MGGLPGPSKQQLYIALLESVWDELTSGSAEVMRTDAPAEDRIRAAIDRFLGYVEIRPAAARVLLTPPEGDFEVLEAWNRVQTEATARLVALLVNERDLLRNTGGRDLRLELFMEFLKKGLHGLAGWWAIHPKISRRVLVDAVMDLVWHGLQSKFATRGGE